MPADALQYATPRRDVQTPRPDWLAVFSFLWAFTVAPAAIVASVAEHTPLPLRFAALVLVPLVAAVTGYVATERGAPWDSPYRATGLAVMFEGRIVGLLDRADCRAAELGLLMSGAHLAADPSVGALPRAGGPPGEQPAAG